VGSTEAEIGVGWAVCAWWWYFAGSRREKTPLLENCEKWGSLFQPWFIRSNLDL